MDEDERAAFKFMMKTFNRIGRFDPAVVHAMTIVGAVESQGRLPVDVCQSLADYVLTGVTAIATVAMVLRGEIVPFMKNGELAFKHPDFNVSRETDEAKPH